VIELHARHFLSIIGLFEELQLKRRKLSINLIQLIKPSLGRPIVSIHSFVWQQFKQRTLGVKLHS